MKTKIKLLLAFLTVSLAVNAQVDRTKMPVGGPAPTIKLGKAQKFTLKNGLKVIMVENHKLPRASVNLTIDNKPYAKGNKKGVSSLTGSLIGRGTSNITKDEFNEKVDYLGANVSFRSSGAFASSLKRYFPEILGLMADGVKNSQFTKEEFDKEVKVTLDNIKNSEKDVKSIARSVEDVLTYGKNHPFGEITTKETIGNITLDDVKNNFNTYYKPNNAYLIIVGDINPKETKKLVTKLFSDWKPGVIPASVVAKPTNVSTTEIDFINMPNAVQSEIALISNINLKLGDKEYYAALLANKILGGGGTARLYLNLREDKGYTYGSYSRVGQSRHAATFRATAAVRNVVTDSSVVEMQKEINKIRYQKATAEELRNAKAEYVGGFVMGVQEPSTVARFALNIARYNLPEDFYENYLKNINAVTLDDVQNAALKYFRGDKARIVITGKGIDVLKNLEKGDYVIKYFDKNGNATVKPPMSLPIPNGVTATTVVDKYIDAIGGKDKVDGIKTIMTTANATIQGTPLVLTSKSFGNKTSNIISVMGNVFQKSVFDGEKGYSEARGKREEMKGEALAKAKAKTSVLSDIDYKKGKLLRIEPIDGKSAYVIEFKGSEIFYDLASGLKVKSVRTSKGADGKETKIPTNFSDYKEVNGVKFPHRMVQDMGQFKLDFKVKEIKINEGVTDADFK